MPSVTAPSPPHRGAVTQCPHPGLRVQDRCYWCLKQRALNGGRSKLSAEALQFVGVGTASPLKYGWTQPYSNDQELEEVAIKRELAAGYVLLARRILEPDAK